MPRPAIGRRISRPGETTPGPKPTTPRPKPTLSSVKPTTSSVKPTTPSPKPDGSSAGVDHRRPVSKSGDDGTFNGLPAVGRIRTEGVLPRTWDRFLRR